MTTVITALREGMRSVRAHWRLALLAWVSSVVVALPLAALMRNHLARGLGRGLAATRMREGWDDLWFQGFAARAEGLATAFQPTVTGIGAMLDALDGMITTGMWGEHASILGAGLTYALLWTFLSGGLMATYAARGQEGSFFARAAAAFPRFLVLAVLSAMAYGVVLGVVLPRLGDVVEQANRQTIDERIHLGWVLAKYLIVWLLVWGVATINGYARALSVLDPGGPLSATLRRTLKLVVRNASLVFGLSALLLGLGVLLGLCWALVAPGAGDSSWVALVATFVLAQAYVFARILVRCSFLACQTELARRLV